ncbi:GNAT family N-acetyltransferase [Arthrobacter sp. zg-ZUI10]|nr:GNAT family N-acetyltransferase [Arthrobacter sunyaminii]
MPIVAPPDVEKPHRQAPKEYRQDDGGRRWPKAAFIRHGNKVRTGSRLPEHRHTACNTLDFRSCGVGRALMTEVARSAAEDLALEHLRLEVRAGMGLEGFYQSCGWREIGRWPEALRLPGGDRDEVLMALALKRNAGPPAGAR